MTNMQRFIAEQRKAGNIYYITEPYHTMMGYRIMVILKDQKNIIFTEDGKLIEQF